MNRLILTMNQFCQSSEIHFAESLENHDQISTKQTKQLNIEAEVYVHSDFFIHVSFSFMSLSVIHFYVVLE